MHAISEPIDLDKVRRRRELINRTAEYLRIERLGIERNAPWMHPEAYRRRIDLLDALASWYDEELSKLDER